MSAAERSQAIGSSAAGADHALRRTLLATCVAAAAKGAEAVRAHAGTGASLDWEEKSATDFVTVVDRASEEAIARVVHERHPDATLVGEELTPDSQIARGLAFVADPLDGTTNFLHAFPWYCVSIAAVIDGAPVAAAILNIPTGELFTATLGAGARRNGQPIAVSRIADPSRALLGTGMPFKHPQHLDRYLASLPEILRSTAGVRRPGSAALDLADVACGRFDAFWELQLAPWDVAAGLLIVREAGGLATDLAGRDAPIGHGPIVAGNPAMHAWLLERLGG
jgi:myo-inositol-1(or 4)-monophosphatase